MPKVKISELGFVKLRKTIETGDKDHPIEIYNPDKKQRDMIRELIKTSTGEDKETGKVITKVSDEDFICKLLGELTNIYIDVEDEKTVKGIIENPSRLLLDVNREISEILDEEYVDYYKSLKSLGKLPKEIVEEIFKVEDTASEIDETEKKIRELEEEIKALKQNE